VEEGVSLHCSGQQERKGHQRRRGEERVKVALRIAKAFTTLSLCLVPCNDIHIHIHTYFYFFCLLSLLTSLWFGSVDSLQCVFDGIPFIFF
jgi:hypothetical protein